MDLYVIMFFYAYVNKDIPTVLSISEQSSRMARAGGWGA